MKKLIRILIIILFALPLMAMEVSEQKFQVTYSLKFNSITLKQASEIEKMLKEKLKSEKIDYCEFLIEAFIDIQDNNQQGWYGNIDSVSDSIWKSLEIKNY